MARFYGLGSGARPGTAPYTVNPGSGYGDYLYRRSDNYYCAFITPVVLGKYFSPLASGVNNFQFADDEQENAGGTVKRIWVTKATSEGNSFIHYWGDISGRIVTNDPRVSYNVTTDITYADFLPDVPARRFDNTQLFLQGSDPSSLWYFKTPLPLRVRFNFEAGTYDATAQIPFDSASPGDGNGRFVHYSQDYTPGGSGGTDAVDGTHFNTYADEQAYNSLSFQLSGGVASKTFNATPSTSSFTGTIGSLSYSSNSEVGGAGSGTAYFPAIVRAEANFTEGGRLHIDCSQTISPSANVIGIYVEDGTRGYPNTGAAASIDHYETTSGVVAGPYIPATEFDIVFKEEGMTSAGYLSLYAVVDSPDFPPTGAPLETEAFPPTTTLPHNTTAFNYLMSVPVMLRVKANAAGRSRFIIRQSGEIRRRPSTTLYQHKGEARFWGMEYGTGIIVKSDDEGETYQPMANAWTGVDGAVPIMTESLGDGGGMSIAKVGTNLMFCASADNEHWETPSIVAPYGSGGWCVREHRASEEAQITIENGAIDDANRKTYISTDTGATWQEVT